MRDDAFEHCPKLTIYIPQRIWYLEKLVFLGLLGFVLTRVNLVRSHRLYSQILKPVYVRRAFNPPDAIRRPHVAIVGKQLPVSKLICKDA
jgi:hypothetical protein